MSSWFKWLPNVFGGARDVAEVFVENKEKKGQRSHDATMAGIGHDMEVLKQFAAEFHEREKRTWWDSLIDGLNRLPRPLLTFAIIGFFVLTPLYPEKFLQIAKAYELMPTGYWALLSIIIGFYFGNKSALAEGKKTEASENEGSNKTVAAAGPGIDDSGEEIDDQEEEPKPAVVAGTN